MAYVREHACCVCSAPGPSDPHHAATGGRGIKADDFTCIPLCRGCHNFWHSHRRFRAQHPTDINDFIRRTQLRLLSTYTYLLENRDGKKSDQEKASGGQAAS